MTALAWIAIAHAQDNLKLGAYAEAYYQVNFNRPSNGVTNLRGFDNRADSVTLSNVALDAAWDDGHTLGRLALQVGATPATYYLAEPSAPGSGGANASGAQLWQTLQQANVGYRLDSGLALSAGLFLSPIGPEGIAVKDNWNFSRSNLFFGLPFYHTGLKVSQPIGGWTLNAAVFNGWNSVVDNNREKSLAAWGNWTHGEDLSVNLLYFGGVERPTGAPEGRAWRHDLDLNATWSPVERLAMMAQGNVGFERNDFGTSQWYAGALYAKTNLQPWLYLAARADVFREFVGESASGSASAIFWPVPWVGSGTATLALEPGERASLRLELRHDRAAGDAFFGGEVEGDGLSAPYVPNRDRQSTLTLGATTWF